MRQPVQLLLFCCPDPGLVYIQNGAILPSPAAKTPQDHLDAVLCRFFGHALAHSEPGVEAFGDIDSNQYFHGSFLLVWWRTELVLCLNWQNDRNKSLVHCADFNCFVSKTNGRFRKILKICKNPRFHITMTFLRPICETTCSCRTVPRSAQRRPIKENRS